jgi:hypothetical protein
VRRLALIMSKGRRLSEKEKTQCQRDKNEYFGAIDYRTTHNNVFTFTSNSQGKLSGKTMQRCDKDLIVKKK